MKINEDFFDDNNVIIEPDTNNQSSRFRFAWLFMVKEPVELQLLKTINLKKYVSKFMLIFNDMPFLSNIDLIDIRFYNEHYPRERGKYFLDDKEIDWKSDSVMDDNLNQYFYDYIDDFADAMLRDDIFYSTCYISVIVEADAIQCPYRAFSRSMKRLVEYSTIALNDFKKVVRDNSRNIYSALYYAGVNDTYHPSTPIYLEKIYLNPTDMENLYSDLFLDGSSGDIEDYLTYDSDDPDECAHEHKWFVYPKERLSRN